MTSNEIEEAMQENGMVGPMMHPNMPTDVATLRATLEVAWQLAILNEQIGMVLNSRIAQIAVRVESGEYPLQVQEQQRRY